MSAMRLELAFEAARACCIMVSGKNSPIARIITRAFASNHIGRYRQPGEDTTNYRYRNVILTNALAVEDDDFRKS